MTEQEARERPLNEVWEAFQKMGHLASDKMRLTHYGLVKFSMLRSVLLERCEADGFKINTGIFAIPERKQMTWEQANEYVASLSFMAWELGQRMKEAGNTTEVIKGN